MIRLFLTDDRHNRQKCLRADLPDGFAIAGHWVFDNCPDQFQYLTNGMLLHLMDNGIDLDDEDKNQIELHLTRPQADDLAASNEFRQFCLGAPDALRHNDRQYVLNDQARKGLSLRIETGDQFYVLRLVVIDEDSDTPILVEP